MSVECNRAGSASITVMVKGIALKISEDVKPQQILINNYKGNVGVGLDNHTLPSSIQPLFSSTIETTSLQILKVTPSFSLNPVAALISAFFSLLLVAPRVRIVVARIGS